MMTYFKSADDYNNFRYFSCVNFNKKSKKDPLKKLLWVQMNAQKKHLDK